MPVGKPQWPGRGPTAAASCEPFPAVNLFGSGHRQVDWGLGEVSLFVFFNIYCAILIKGKYKGKNPVDRGLFLQVLFFCVLSVLKPCHPEYRKYCLILVDHSHRKL